MALEERFEHRRLSCGVELATLPLPGRRTCAYEIRMFAGLVDEPEPLGGLARVLEESISKGTESRTAQQMSDAFDALGAQAGSGVGRESFVFRCNCLPECLEKSLALHAEMLRTPTFPAEFCEVAVELLQQELTSLEDDPGELTRRMIGPHAYGQRLGRHELGTAESLSRIGREDIVSFWRSKFTASRMQISIGGAVDPEKSAAHVERLFAGYGSSADNEPERISPDFSPGRRSFQKEQEQQQILICWPGVAVSDPEYPIERIMLGVLGEGMSSRLFTEVREKQGLVYWVGAWDEHPRTSGRLFMGASTTPARFEQTYDTLVREVRRLAQDVTPEEVERAQVGIIAKTQTHGDITRARVSELSGDLFYFGRPVPISEKNAKLAAVTVSDVKAYLGKHPPESLCVMTLGPRAWEA